MGAPLYPTLLFEFRNIETLSRHLVETYGDIETIKARASRRIATGVARGSSIKSRDASGDLAPRVGTRDR